jgi:glycosyltransferase involved in cell wall biosynthesis
MNVTLFVPVLNEIEGLRAIMPAIDASLFSQVLVVDGNSTDGSAEWARSQGYDVHVQTRRGIRHAYIEAWPMITGDYVVTFSPDGNCKPEDIPAIIAKLEEGHDMVIASRYLGSASSEDDSLLTRFGNWMFTFLINRLHGGHYTDAMTIFRGYRTSLFRELGLDLEEPYQPEQLFNTVIGIEPVLSIRAARRNCKVSEVPSDEPKRVHGERKLQIFRWGASYLAQVFRELLVP